MTIHTAAAHVGGTIHDRAATLLSEADSLISHVDAVLADQTAARLAIAEAEAEMTIIEASLTFTIEGQNESERKARLALALQADPGHQELCRSQQPSWYRRRRYRPAGRPRPSGALPYRS